MRSMGRIPNWLFALAFFLGLATQARSQGLSPEVPNRPTKEQLANDNNLFMALAKKVLKWEEPEEPVRIIGPLYFVGTKGLGAFLFTTTAYSLNNLTAKPDATGAYTIQFGGCRQATPNCLPIVKGWNYTVRLYRPRKAILDDSWKLPQAHSVM